MEFKTIILRFRDLVTEKGETISNHKKIIEKKRLFGGDGGARAMRKLPFWSSLCYAPISKAKKVGMLYTC